MQKRYQCAECSGTITTMDDLITINVAGHAKPAHRYCPEPLSDYGLDAVDRVAARAKTTEQNMFVGHDVLLSMTTEIRQARDYTDEMLWIIAQAVRKVCTDPATGTLSSFALPVWRDALLVLARHKKVHIESHFGNLVTAIWV